MQCGMARAKAKETLPKRSPMLDDTLVHLALMPSRAWATPEAFKAAWPGVDRLRMEATERASHRAADAAKPRAHDRGKKTADAEEDGHGAPAQVSRLSGADVERTQSR